MSYTDCATKTIDNKSLCYGMNMHLLHELDAQSRQLLHPSVEQPLNRLISAAQKQGFDLLIASAHRSYERQLQLWNAKMNGGRVVYDRDGHVIELKSLSTSQKVETVLLWSALPGASRHHWGTDFDIYDRNALHAGDRLQLIPEEYQQGGPFAPMVEWLRAYLQTHQAPDFFFPYVADNNGVQPEPWHISYQPTASAVAKNWSLQTFMRHLEKNNVAAKEFILSHIDTLYARFIQPSLFASRECITNPTNPIDNTHD